jgi:DNA helicase-2/ATP-dependent DNA helicase PcrA
MSTQILNGLNDRQIEAVTSISGSTLVIAGAGSGKTSVLTRRCAFLISQGVLPGQILSLTFTNKAAMEMNSRVIELLNNLGINIIPSKSWQNDYSSAPLLCTFHSLGVRLVREFGHHIDIKSTFSIIDNDDQKKIIKEILKQKNLDPKNISPDLVLYFIGQCKQNLLTSGDSKLLNKEFLPVFHQIYAAYEQTLRQSQSVDFDDLILIPYLILRDFEEVRTILQSRWSHLLVDEFQDTNQAQFELIRLLAPESLILSDQDRSIFVVGDDAQSIYSFRGSKIEIILNFEHEYSQTKTIVLNQNYRSTQPILDLAEKIISLNPFQKKKELFTENQDKMQVKYYLARDERAEADYIMRQINLQYGQNTESTQTTSRAERSEASIDEDISILYDDIENSLNNRNKPAYQAPKPNNDFVSNMFDVYLELDDAKPSFGFNGFNQLSQWQVPSYDWAKIPDLNKVAVLYRTHSQSRILEEVFLKSKLPYRLTSGVRFLDRKEVKDVLALLKFVLNGEDILALKRVLPLLLDGVGPKTLDKIIAHLQEGDVDLPEKVATKVYEFFRSLQSAWANHTSIIDLTKEILATTGYMRYLKEEYPQKDDYESRVENIGELYSIMFAFDQGDDTKNLSLGQKLQTFLEQISLMTNLDGLNQENENNKVTLMSLHQSKGLEFETVFLVGIEDGLLPHINSFQEERGLEEEIRLAYVGVTRAKKYLHLSAAESRIQFGQIKANPVSRIFRPLLDKYAQRAI